MVIPFPIPLFVPIRMELHKQIEQPIETPESFYAKSVSESWIKGDANNCTLMDLELIKRDVERHRIVDSKGNLGYLKKDEEFLKALNKEIKKRRNQGERLL